MPNLISLLVPLLLAPAAAPPGEAKKVVTIFVARKVVTMERRQPFVTAVAVADGRIVAAGTLDEVKRAIKGREATIDRSFADKVLLPGFVAAVEPQDADLSRLRTALHQGGVTTAADLSGRAALADTPFRTLRVRTLTPADVSRSGKKHWEAGRQLVVRGDVDASLDALAALLKEKPADDHRFAIVSSEKWSAEQCERLAKLGGVASVDPRQVTRAGALVKNRVPLALRCASKETVSPLSLAGALSGQDDKVTVLAALRAVTIDAAFVLRQEKEIGSIAPGKKADFAVLDEDPLAVSLAQLKDVAVWGTVYEGKKRPARQSVGWGDRPKRQAAQTSGAPRRHVGLLGDDLDPRREGLCDPSCPCRGGPRSKTLPLDTSTPRRGR
jgi:predicted amidohydrolase YtcJ